VRSASHALFSHCSPLRSTAHCAYCCNSYCCCCCVLLRPLRTAMLPARTAHRSSSHGRTASQVPSKEQRTPTKQQQGLLPTLPPAPCVHTKATGAIQKVQLGWCCGGHSALAFAKDWGAVRPCELERCAVRAGSIAVRSGRIRSRRPPVSSISGCRYRVEQTRGVRGHSMAWPLICCQRLQASAGLHGERRLASGSCLAGTRPRNLAVRVSSMQRDGQFWQVQARNSPDNSASRGLERARSLEIEPDGVVNFQNKPTSNSSW
jgi:hypothetical protein